MGKRRTFFQACEDNNIEEVKKYIVEQGFRVNDVNPIDGFTGLHYAADAGSEEVLRYLLQEHKADVNKTGPDGSTPLHWAVRTPGRKFIIKCLLFFNADPNIQGKFGRAPIHIAASKGYTDNLIELKEAQIKKVNINLSDNVNDPSKGTTALHLAAQGEHLECVRALFSKFKDKPQTSARNSKHQLALHVACTCDNVEIVKKVIEEGKEEDLSSRDLDGRTPLMYACLHKNSAVVEFLTQLGKQSSSTVGNRSVDVNFSTSKGETALHCGAAGGVPKIINFLIEAGAAKSSPNNIGLTPLHIACQHGHLEAVKALLDHDAEVEAKGNHGETPLMEACAGNNSPDIAKLLVDRGAQHWAHDTAGDSPIHHAVMRNRPDVLEYLMTLMSENTIEDDIDNSQNTPVHIASKLGHHNCLKLLLDNNYKLSKPNKKGETSVHLATKEGRVETLQLLLDQDSEVVGLEDKLGNRALHVAARHAQNSCCRLLMDNGAAVNHSNIRGVTPLHLAAESGSRGACKLFLGFEADINAVDINEDTPLHYAARKGEEGTAELLIDKECRLDLYNQHGENALIAAIRSNNEDIIAMILQSDNWKSALKLKKERCTPSSRSIRHKMDLPVDRALGDDTWRISEDPLHQLIIHYPNQARAVFDRCTKADDTISEQSSDYWVEFDYSLVIEENSSHDRHPFTTMLEHNRIELLDHPLISSLISHQWNNHAKYPFYLNVALNVLFTIFITTYALMEVSPTLSNPPEKSESLLLVLAMVAAFFNVARFLMELLQLIIDRKSYIRDPLNYFEVAATGLAGIFLSSVFTDGPSKFQWEAGCFVLVLSWTNTLLSLKKLPYIGSFVIMVSIMIRSMLGVILPIFLFLVPFALAFHMMFSCSFGSFRTPGYALVKTLAMFQGDITFDTYMVPASLDGPNVVKYPVAAYVIYNAFLLLCCVILMNLLTGLAILDVAETKKMSKLLRSAQRIDQIFLSDNSFVLNLLSKGGKRKRFPTENKIYPNKASGFGGSGFDFKGLQISEIVGRQRTVESDHDKKLRKIQTQISNFVAGESKLNAKMNLILKFMQISGGGSSSLSDVQHPDPDILSKIKSRISMLEDKE